MLKKPKPHYKVNFVVRETSVPHLMKHAAIVIFSSSVFFNSRLPSCPRVQLPGFFLEGQDPSSRRPRRHRRISADRDRPRRGGVQTNLFDRPLLLPMITAQAASVCFATFHFPSSSLLFRSLSSWSLCHWGNLTVPRLGLFVRFEGLKRKSCLLMS